MKLFDRMRLLLSSDESGASPVVAVILVVGVTIILAGLTVVFTLDFTEKNSGAAPQGSFTMFQETETFTEGRQAAGTNETTVVYIRYQDGEILNSDNLQVKVNGQQAWDVVGLNETSSNYGGSYVYEPINTDEVVAGDQFRVVFPENGLENESDVGIRNGGEAPFFSDEQSSGNLRPLKEGDTVSIVYEIPESTDTALLDEFEVE